MINELNSLINIKSCWKNWLIYFLILRYEIDFIIIHIFIIISIISFIMMDKDKVDDPNLE